ncbi:hypothetical protein [Parasitella parasitica]|uniref:RNA-directed DNA polymerase n=1 Tax=Parasitella parasitica TaxID=35722 RepID=A0A0B7NCI9_9FUNG|nr:hypothetical protein [Parasitella parasitica]
MLTKVQTARTTGTRLATSVARKVPSRGTLGARRRKSKITSKYKARVFLKCKNKAKELSQGGSRFRMKVTTDDDLEQDVLVDTGATISTVLQGTVRRLDLNDFACPQHIICYGYTSMQVRASKVVLDFRFNEKETSRAYLPVVPHWDEEVIRGMDLLEKEDMVLHPWLKTVTTASYSHSIDTGTAQPMVKRNFGRSPAENEAIAKEVEAMLKKDVIVPSNSNWCSLVVLIEKPNGSFRFCVDYLNLNKKCLWFQQEVKFLGFLVSVEGIRANPDKVKVVKDWKRTVKKKGLLRFLGFAVFYHWFIDSLSSKAKPPYALLKKDVEYVWSKEAYQEAFALIKKELVSLPTLAYPNPQSHTTSTVILSTRTLNSAECNYTTTEKEGLAVVWSLRQFHSYLYGSQLTIYTAHAALRSILGTKLPRVRLARWIMNFQELTLFQNVQKADPTIKFILRENLQQPYVWHNNLMCYSEARKLLPFVPVGFIEQVLFHVHSKNTGGYFGDDKTLHKVNKIGWWPNKREDKRHQAASNKANNQSKLHGEVWATEIAVLPESHTGERYLLVIMEYVTKLVVAVPLRSFNTSSIVHFLLYEVVLKYSLPARLITENGTNYISEALQMVCSSLGISRSNTRSLMVW